MGSPRARPAAAGAIVAVAAWLAFYTGWLLLAPAGEHARLVFADTAYLVPIAAAVLLSAWAATRVPKGLRGFWLLVSLACALAGSPGSCSGASSSSATPSCRSRGGPDCLLLRLLRRDLRRAGLVLPAVAAADRRSGAPRRPAGHRDARAALVVARASAISRSASTAPPGGSATGARPRPAVHDRDDRSVSARLLSYVLADVTSALVDRRRYYGFYGAVLIALVSFFRPSLRLIGGQATPGRAARRLHARAALVVARAP